MSLLRRNKDKQLAAEKKLAAQHEIVKMGVDRNVRDAYFHGLVFAAVANDDQIDESEQIRLRELGEALELTAEEGAEAIQSLAGMDDDAKMSVIEECARQLMNVKVAECFLKEFSELWLLGGGNKDEVTEFKSQLIDWMGDDVRVAEEEKIKAAERAEANRKAEDAKLKAERERQIAKERQRANKTFGDDALQVVKELSLYDKDKLSSDELERLRNYLLGEGYGVVDFEQALNKIKSSCVDAVPKVGRLRIERDPDGLIKKISLEYSGKLSDRLRKDKDKRLCLRKEAVWKLIGLAAVKNGFSDRTVKFVNRLLVNSQSAYPEDLCLHWFWAWAVEWRYLKLFSKNTMPDVCEVSGCISEIGAKIKTPNKNVAPPSIVRSKYKSR